MSGERFTVDLEVDAGDASALLRLRSILKGLLRVHGVRCLGIRPMAGQPGPGINVDRSAEQREANR